jgi:predicted ribosome quality control (RQC) complex YloA/Tae2 family protein
MEELRRELGETRFAKERLEVESRSVREISDKRKKALDDALAKLQEKKLQVEKQAEELNKRAEDIDAVNKKYEEIQATLSEGIRPGSCSAIQQFLLCLQKPCSIIRIS